MSSGPGLLRLDQCVLELVFRHLPITKLLAVRQTAQPLREAIDAAEPVWEDLTSCLLGCLFGEGEEAPKAQQQTAIRTAFLLSGASSGGVADTPERTLLTLERVLRLR